LTNQGRESSGAGEDTISISLGALLPRHARYRPDHPALRIGGHQLTFKQLNAQVNRLASALLAHGIEKGDKVATVLPNCLELVLMYWAAAKTGAVIVPASPLLQDVGLATLLDDSDAAMVVADAKSAPVLARIRGELRKISSDRYVLAGDAPTPNEFVAYDDFVSEATEDEPRDPGIAGGDPYNIIYSSGTTGAPKGIVHSHQVRANYCTMFASAYRITPESVILHAGSIVFNGAMLVFLPWAYAGCRFILHEAFDAGRVIAEIETSGITHILMVPSQIMAVMNHPDYAPEKFASLEMLQNAGAPLLLEYKKRLNAELPGRFYELYGLTEGFMTVLDKHDAMRKEGSVGVPPAFYEMKILAPDGAEAPTGDVGEICGRGPMMMDGYYKQPSLTEKAVVDGWLHSGDAGYVDEDGFLYLVDRIKDMIISGGVNVYPKDIEEVIIQHPAVAEVAVFGIPDEHWGEAPVAAVVQHAGATLDTGELTSWTNQRVGAKFQRIKGCLILTEFPRNVAGKTLKREIREAYLRWVETA
jgi:acyl-CoA synthetase (AMP-forming)/AMP-acid ligase II